jgi:hypothetical protein
MAEDSSQLLWERSREDVVQGRVEWQLKECTQSMSNRLCGGGGARKGRWVREKVRDNGSHVGETVLDRRERRKKSARDWPSNTSVCLALAPPREDLVRLQHVPMRMHATRNFTLNNSVMARIYGALSVQARV